MKNRNILKLIFGLGVFLLVFGACSDDDQQAATKDLFRPKLISGYPLAEGNIIKVLWYSVNNSASYTVQLAEDEAFNSIVEEVTTKDVFYRSPRLPYATKYYLRIRTNAFSEVNNSIWKSVNISTEERDVQVILKEVDDSNISESTVKVEWLVDALYPADSLYVQMLGSSDETESTSQEIKLTEQQYLAGSYVVGNLEMATTYKVTIFNSKAEDVYERAYNSVTFKTAGPPEGAKVITAQDNLDLILQADQQDTMIPDGQVYYLRGGEFDINGFTFLKGIQLIGAPGIETLLNIRNSFTPINEAGKLVLSNVTLKGDVRLISNEVNDGQNYNWQGLELLHCTISDFPTGFMILQTSAGNKKSIQKIVIDDCLFNQMKGGKLIETDNFSDRTQVMAEINYLSISNSTFMNSPNMLLLFLPDAYGYSGSNIELIMSNVTVFEALGRNGNTRTIQMNRLSNLSKVSISKCLFSNEVNASSDAYMFYETCLCGSAVTSYSQNYITGSRDETGRKGVNAIKLNMTQQETFTDYANGDLTIKAISSVIYTDEIGDSRWLN